MSNRKKEKKLAINLPLLITGIAIIGITIATSFGISIRIQSNKKADINFLKNQAEIIQCFMDMENTHSFSVSDAKLGVGILNLVLNEVSNYNCEGKDLKQSQKLLQTAIETKIESWKELFNDNYKTGIKLYDDSKDAFKAFEQQIESI